MDAYIRSIARYNVNPSFKCIRWLVDVTSFYSPVSKPYDENKDKTGLQVQHRKPQTISDSARTVSGDDHQQMIVDVSFLYFLT